MSSNNGDAGKPVVLANPYAKKRKFPPTTAANHGGVAGRTPPAAAAASTSAGPAHPGLNPVKMGGAFSFSQAFGSVEDTAHYKNQITASANRNSGNNQPDQESAAAQRAMDQQEATNANANANANLPDRDHHILLQPHVLYVSTKQRGNGILKHIRNVPFAYSKMVPDYIMSTTRCALFLSIKYHQLFPNYIHRRLGELKTDFTLRILLVLVDAKDNANPLLFLNKLAVTHNLTLILAWTEAEAARYLETFKALDGKDASLIQKRSTDNFVEQVADYLTACKPVNKTDSHQLLAHFSNIRAVADASPDELALCPGLGPTKVQRLWDALHKPFSKRGAQERKKQKDRSGEQAGLVVLSESANGKGDASATTSEKVKHDKQDEEKANKVNVGGGNTEQDAIKQTDEASNEKAGQVASNKSFQRSLALAEQDIVVDLTQDAVDLTSEQDIVDLTSRSSSNALRTRATSNENCQQSLALSEQQVIDMTSRSTSNANNVSTQRVTIPTISASNFYGKAAQSTIATRALLLSSQGTMGTQHAASQTSTKIAPFNPYSTSRVLPLALKPKITKPKTTRTLTSLLSGVKTTDELLNPTLTAKAAKSVQHASRNLKPPPPPPVYQKMSEVVASRNSERQEKEEKSRKKRKSN